jgi:hypothetical protein
MGIHWFCAVVVLQRLALQTIARIARQISGGSFAWHVISPITRLWMKPSITFKYEAGQPSKKGSNRLGKGKRAFRW